MNLPRPIDGLLRHPLEGQVLVYDSRSGFVHLLDATTGLVLELLQEGGWTREGIVFEIAERLKLPREGALLELALDQLSEAHLLESSTHLNSMNELDRREMIKRLAMTGATALLVPTIATLAASPAYAQGTLRGTGQACTDGSQCVSGQCCGSACRPACNVANGGACQHNSACVSGNCCSGTCQPLKCNGATCGAGSECQSGNCCGGVCTTTTCTTADGQTCTTNSECVSNRCVDVLNSGGSGKQCCATKAAFGQSCTQNSDCCSNSCNTGAHTCKGP